MGVHSNGHAFGIVQAGLIVSPEPGTTRRADTVQKFACCRKDLDLMALSLVGDIEVAFRIRRNLPRSL